MASDPFESPRELIAWADEDIQDLHRQILEFFAADSYSEFREINPETGHRITGIRLNSDVPSRFRKLASCALSNLRHSLDQSVYAASVAIGQPIEDNFTFPFATTARDLNARLSKGKIPLELHAAIRSLNPYPTGDSGTSGEDLLAKLAKVAGHNKHRVRLEFGGNVRSISNISASGSGFFRLIQEWDTKKKELILYEADPEAHVDYHSSITFYVAFGDIAGLEHTPVLPALTFFVARAKAVLDALQAAAHLAPPRRVREV